MEIVEIVFDTNLYNWLQNWENIAGGDRGTNDYVKLKYLKTNTCLWFLEKEVISKLYINKNVLIKLKKKTIESMGEI